jgi:hypothetical protein
MAGLVYVRPFSHLVSQRAGTVYVSTSDNHIMVFSYTAKSDSFVPDKPREWSSTPIGRTGNMYPLAIAPDGKRFVILPSNGDARGDDKASVHVTVLLNFFVELRRRMK